MIVKPVVVAVFEPEGATAAIGLGIDAARRLGAPLVLAGVAVENGDGPPDAPDAMRAAVTRALLRQADAVPDDVPCTVHATRAASVPDGLRAVAEREHAQLLIVGADDRAPRPAPCPVLIPPRTAGVPVDTVAAEPSR